MVHLEWATDGELVLVVVGCEVHAEDELSIGRARPIHDVELEAVRGDSGVDLQCM